MSLDQLLSINATIASHLVIRQLLLRPFGFHWTVLLLSLVRIFTLVGRSTHKGVARQLARLVLWLITSLR